MTQCGMRAVVAHFCDVHNQRLRVERTTGIPGWRKQEGLKAREIQSGVFKQDYVSELL